jgi:Glycosyltransferase Family 4
MVYAQVQKMAVGALSGYDRPLRIAQVAPLYESVPPKLYGGTERIVAYLAEELVRRGHDVTLFAAGDSTAAVPLSIADAQRRARPGSGAAVAAGRDRRRPD